MTSEEGSEEALEVVNKHQGLPFSWLDQERKEKKKTLSDKALITTSKGTISLNVAPTLQVCRVSDMCQSRARHLF